MHEVYETERLILKIIDKSYVELVIDYYQRNKSFFEEWDAVKNDDFYEKPYQEELLEKELSEIKNKRCLRLWIFNKQNSNKIIGTVSFSNIVWGAFLSCHLGYKLDKEEINKGYITEAIQKGIDIIFKEYGLHRIEANIMPKNIRSLRVAEKLGFYNEGLAYKYLKIQGKWEDHVHMVLLNENV